MIEFPALSSREFQSQPPGITGILGGAAGSVWLQIQEFPADSRASGNLGSRDRFAPDCVRHQCPACGSPGRYKAASRRGPLDRISFKTRQPVAVSKPRRRDHRRRVAIRGRTDIVRQGHHRRRRRARRIAGRGEPAVEGYDGAADAGHRRARHPLPAAAAVEGVPQGPDHDLLPLRPESFYEKNDIRLMLSTEAAAIDRRERDAAPRRRPRPRPSTGWRLRPARGRACRRSTASASTASLPCAIADDARRIRERLYAASDVVVVGGGFIGLEIAATARLLGKTVTVLEAADRLMGRVVAPEISAPFPGAPSRLGQRRPPRHAGRPDRRRRRARSPRSRPPPATASPPTWRSSASASCPMSNSPRAPASPSTTASSSTTSWRPARRRSWRSAIAPPSTIGSSAGASGWNWCRTPSIRRRPPPRRCSASASPFARCRGSGRIRATSSCRWSACPYNATRSVLRGKPDDGTFSVFHFEDERLVAIDLVNRAADHMVGRRLIGAGHFAAGRRSAPTRGST